jgi:hypothetical protein
VGRRAGHWWLVLALSIPAGGLLVRLFIISTIAARLLPADPRPETTASASSELLHGDALRRWKRRMPSTIPPPATSAVAAPATSTP